MRPPVLQERILKKLRNRILSGQYPAGFRLPTEPELAKSLEISRDCLRAALKQLGEEHLVERIPRKGTFVRGAKAAIAENVIYYLLPCADFITVSGYMSAQGHMEAMSGALKAAEEENYRLLPVPVSPSNDENDIDFKKLEILTKGSRVLMTGISWFWKIFPLLNALKCRTAGELPLQSLLPECEAYGWQLYVFDSVNFFQGILKRFRKENIRRPLFINHHFDPILQKRHLAMLESYGMTSPKENFLYVEREDALREKITELHRKNNFDGILLNFFEYHPYNRKNIHDDLNLPSEIPVILSDRFPYLLDFEQKPAFFDFDTRELAYRAVKWLASGRAPKTEFPPVSYFPASNI